MMPVATPRAISDVIDGNAQEFSASAWLFWDSSLGSPPRPKLLLQWVTDNSTDVWHAGLRLGMAGLPGIIDFVDPTWMLNRDPDPDIEATSWRLSIRCCLIRTAVLRQLGGPLREFSTIEAAMLEMGHRYIKHGVLMRNTPALVGTHVNSAMARIPVVDELRFVLNRYGRKWMLWGGVRALLASHIGVIPFMRNMPRLLTARIPAELAPYVHAERTDEASIPESKVSVLIPTIGRYPYLIQLLEQLRKQSVRPLEIIVIDQTPASERDATLKRRFADLPLYISYLDEAGQCLSRNYGLQKVHGDFILFIDDDDEVESDLIERHLRNLDRFSADVSAGVAHEVDAGPLPAAFRLLRASDVFPTNNSLVCRHVLRRSGLFDLAYNRGQRADGDLGMRMYLSGASMILDPDIGVLHHHAPRGGLRTHKARVITYASSRSRITHLHLPSVSEIYLTMRYFSHRQVYESLWLRVLGTFSLRGSSIRRMAKVLWSLFRLPHTLAVIRRRSGRATALLQQFPQIPSFEERKYEELA